MTAWASSAGGDWDLPGLLRGLFGEPDRGHSHRGSEHQEQRSESRSSGPWGDGPFGGARGGGGPFGGATFDPPWGRRGDWGRDIGKDLSRMLGGFGGWGGPGGPRGPRRARGDVRSALLALLSERPMHGYQMIQEIGRRSGGSWKASPGSVYPTLQQLEDEGLVRAEDLEGRRVFRLTAAGEQEAADRAAEFAELWEGVAPKRDDSQLGELVFGVAAAFVQVAKTGNAQQMARARKVLARTRADLYRILGENPDGTAAGGADNGTRTDGDDDDSAEGSGSDQNDTGDHSGAVDYDVNEKKEDGR